MEAPRQRPGKLERRQLNAVISVMGHSRRFGRIMATSGLPPVNGHCQNRRACLKGADIVAKVFLGRRTKILGAADAFCARRSEGPYRFIRNRSRASVVALRSDATPEKSKDQLSRDF